MSTAVAASTADAHRALWLLVRDRWRPNGVHGHGPDHARRVYRHGLAFAAAEGADALVVGAACLVMDAGLDPVQGRHDHVARSAEIARAACSSLPSLRSAVDRIVDAVEWHEAESDPPVHAPIETLVVRDADTADRLGRSGVRMTIRYGNWTQRALYEPDDPFCAERSPALDDYTFDYLVHLRSLPARLRTGSGRALGAAKSAELEQFLERARQQIDDLPRALTEHDALRLLSELPRRVRSDD
jgi:uncharacterized protein